jgi:hypothetical protein
MASYSYELINKEHGIREVIHVISKNRKTADIIMEVNKHLLNKVMNGYSLQLN